MVLLADGTIGQFHYQEHLAVLTKSTFHVADAVKPPQSTTRFVLVTLPKEARFKEWLKAPDVERLGMTIWDYSRWSYKSWDFP